jgi:hypothetical protein
MRLRARALVLVSLLELHTIVFKNIIIVLVVMIAVMMVTDDDKTKLRGLSPRANSTYRATAACRRR